MTPPAPPRLRPASLHDLDAANAVIERAVMTWALPERVKRLAMPSYRYHRHDLEHFRIMVAEAASHDIVGVAAWGPAEPRDVPAGQHGLLLHGLYVDPRRQRRGIGTLLLAAALAAAREQGYDGLLVKAQADAVGFFAASGLVRLTVKDPQRDYALRYWQAVS
jgi:GNAT superfamily N-acetyltransferase